MFAVKNLPGYPAGKLLAGDKQQSQFHWLMIGWAGMVLYP